MNDTIEPERWWLSAVVPPTVPGVKVNLELIREVTGDELRKVRDANRILTRLANAEQYSRLVSLYSHLQQTASSKERKSAVRRSKETNDAARALSNTAKSLADNMRQSIADDFGAESAEAEQLERAISQECNRPEYLILLEIAELDSGPFTVANNAVINDPKAIASISEKVPGLQPNSNLPAILSVGVLIAQRLVGRELEIYTGRVSEAGLVLRSLAAQVPDGAVGLVRADHLEDAPSETGLGPMAQEPLALEEAVRLHRAIRATGQLLAQTNSLIGANTPPPVVVPRSQDQVQPASAPAQDPAAEPSEKSSTTSSAAPPVSTNDLPLDMTALLAHATTMTDSLERAWSDSLAQDELLAGQTEMVARIQSLMSALHRRIEHTQQILDLQGVASRLAAYPLPQSEFGALSFEPDTTQRWHQTQLAELEALAPMLAAFNAMRSPSARRIQLPSGIEETWWEAGAFDLLRSRARLVVSLSRQADAAAKELAGQQPVPTVRSVFEKIQLAGSSLSHGDVVAALTHAWMAITERAAVERVPVPEDLPQRLSTHPQLLREAAVVLLLHEAIQRISRGQIVDLGVATLLAPRAISLAEKVCISHPQIIQEALAVDSSASPDSRTAHSGVPVQEPPPADAQPSDKSGR